MRTNDEKVGTYGSVEKGQAKAKRTEPLCWRSEGETGWWNEGGGGENENGTAESKYTRVN